MADPFGDFLAQPSVETFLALRSGIIGAPGFDMTSDGLARLESLIEQEAHASVPDLVPELMPTWLLSARVHVLLGQSAEARGEPDRAKSEALLAEACMIGLQSTGDGTPGAPFRPVLPSDEYDLAQLLGKDVVKQRREDRDGRAFDVLTSADQTDLWFDITDGVIAMINRNAEG